MSQKSDKPDENAPSTKSEKLSPSAFMRNLRPEYYSDTKDRVNYTLDRSTFEYFLESLTARNETHDFEIFCRKLCERTICPHLRPNTGPDGGGDGKTDAETVMVADEIMNLGYIGEPNAGRERWAFAFSAKEKWVDKVRSDVAGIVGTARKYDRIYCVTSRFAKAKIRAELEQELENAHKIPITILDRTWIVEQIIDHQRIDIAFNYFKVGKEIANTASLGPTDYSRAKQLEEIEKSIADPLAFKGMEYQRATEALVAAELSRNLERPRIETDGRFARAIRFAEQDGDFRQKLTANYELIWTGYWWFDDISLLLAKYSEFEILALQATHARHLELLTNLLQLLFNSVIHKLVTREECRLDERAENARAALQKMAEEVDRPNHSLEAQTGLLLLRMNWAIVNNADQDLPAIWKDFREILTKAKGLSEFSALRVAKLIELAGDAAGNNPEYNALIEQLAEFIGERESEGRSGVILLNRADKLDMEHHFDIIRLAGRATVRLTKKEYSSELAHALQLLTVAYRKAGLLWAARASCLFVAAAFVIETEEDNKIPISFLRTMEIFAWIALELGHLPDALLAIQMLYGAAATIPLTDKTKDKINTVTHELDIVLGSILLNADAADIARLEYLPDLLERLSLFTSRTALLYALGHEQTLLEDGSVPQNESLESLREMMNMLASQPAARQAARKLIFNEPPETLITTIMGMRIEILTLSASDKAMRLAELAAAALEAFFATALQQNILPHSEKFKIRISLSDKNSEPSFTVNDLAADGELIWPIGLELYKFSNQEVLHKLLLILVSKVLSRNFVIENSELFLQKLFADDAVKERMTGVVAMGNSYHRFVQRYSTQLADWRDQMKTKFDKRSRPQINNSMFPDEPKSKETAPTATLRERPQVDDHRKITVHSIIDVIAWDQAAWSGTGFLRDYAKQPPVLALLFKNEVAARAIFAGWRDRVGQEDKQNQIYIAIIREYEPSRPNHYIVQIAPASPKFEEMARGHSHFFASRCLENASNDGVNLTRFLRDYYEMGAYYLCAGIVQNEKEPLWLLDSMILKRELSVKRAAEIKDLDVEAMALRSVLKNDNSSEQK